MSGWDIIVVGAGSAGCVMARRLADAGARVLLLEAGPRDFLLDYRIHMPAALSHLLSGTAYNWNYESEPEPHLNNRRVYCPRGRVLGGSSSINGMIFVRGNAADFDGWAEQTGYDEWRYDACLPYFRKLESMTAGNPDYHGTGGPMHVTRGDLDNPLYEAFMTAGEQAGHARNDDMNGAVQEGVGPFDRTVWQGRRWSAAMGYLRGDGANPNLEVRSRCSVQRIVFDGSRATGVVVKQGRRIGVLNADQVVLCGGAINSPQLLQLSGIGDPAVLQPLGIDMTQALPAVGRNLSDHLEVYVQQACTQPVTIAPALRLHSQALIGIEWYLRKTGLGATNHFEAGGFIRSSDAVTWPDIQYHFLPIAMNYDGSVKQRGHGFQLHAGPMKPTSRGEVSLKSADPSVAPRIQFNYASTEADRAVMRAAIREARRIFAQDAFAPFRGEELQPGSAAESDADIDAFVAEHGESAYHPACTCAMGKVVEADGRVMGVEGLRVVDASIMPEITNGNLNSPVLMMAEKIAATMTGSFAEPADKSAMA